MTNISNLKQLFQGYVEQRDGTVAMFSMGTPNQLAGQVRSMTALHHAARRTPDIYQYMPAHQRVLLKPVMTEERWFERAYAVPLHEEDWMQGGAIELGRDMIWRWVGVRND